MAPRLLPPRTFRMGFSGIPSKPDLAVALAALDPTLGFAHVDRGAVLVAYTDGVVERTRADGEHFGVERVQE